MMNPGTIMKLMNEKNAFEGRHPKFAAFLQSMFANRMIDQGSIIEIKVKKADGTEITGNMRVMPEDMQMIEEIKQLGQGM